jgi:hypothetical protein
MQGFLDRRSDGPVKAENDGFASTEYLKNTIRQDCKMKKTETGPGTDCVSYFTRLSLDVADIGCISRNATRNQLSSLIRTTMQHRHAGGPSRGGVFFFWSSQSSFLTSVFPGSCRRCVVRGRTELLLLSCVSLAPDDPKQFN